MPKCNFNHAERKRMTCDVPGCVAYANKTKKLILKITLSKIKLRLIYTASFYSVL